MPFDALFSCRNNKKRLEIVQKNIACHQKLWYYENEKVSIVGKCPAERRYHAGAAISTGLKVLAYFRPLSPYRSGAGLRDTRSPAPGNLCMPKYALYAHLLISRLLYRGQ